MVIHEIDANSPPELQRRIQEFEASFVMPLGNGRAFRIDYGADRTAFIRTLGESRSFVAESDGRITGLIEMAMVDLLLPCGQTKAAAYIADIKMLPEARGSIATGRLLARASAWGVSNTDLAFTVTLDGAPIKPPSYTGRLGIPAFSDAGRLSVVRLPVTQAERMRPGDERMLAGDEEGEAVHRRLTQGRYALLGCASGLRSAEPPVWLTHPGGMACGRFEDRRKVRRLIADDGTELRPAYLSCFAFQDPQAAIDLILAALRRAGSLGYRAVRLCMPADDLALLQRVLGPGVIEGTGGTVFATAAAEVKAPWNLNAAEI